MVYAQYIKMNYAQNLRKCHNKAKQTIFRIFQNSERNLIMHFHETVYRYISEIQWISLSFWYLYTQILLLLHTFGITIGQITQFYLYLTYFHWFYSFMNRALNKLVYFKCCTYTPELWTYLIFSFIFLCNFSNVKCSGK